jgi:hypothetical protein
MQPNADSLTDSAALIADLRAQVRELTDQLGRMQLAIREGRFRSPRLQARAFYRVGDKVETYALQPEQVQGLYEEIEIACREAANWSLYDRWERSDVEIGQWKRAAETAWAERDALQARIDGATSDGGIERCYDTWSATKDMRAAIAAALSPNGGR